MLSNKDDDFTVDVNDLLSKEDDDFTVESLFVHFFQANYALSDCQ